jgi:hypothetical protein
MAWVLALAAEETTTWLCLFQRSATSAFLPGVTAVYVAFGCFLTDGMYYVLQTTNQQNFFGLSYL